MKTYKNHINEGYFRQDLYHFTTIFPLKNILETDKLDLGYYLNPFNGEKIKTVSLTRNKNLNLDKKTTIRLELDGDLLYQDYNSIPYDFFINDNQETQPKSDINRIKNDQTEEIILKPISNIHKYLKTIVFFDKNDINKEEIAIKNILNLNNNIIFKYNNKEIKYE